MKKTIMMLASAALSLAAFAESYTLIGERHLRKYTAPSPSQVYNAETDAQQVVNNLCFVDWVLSQEKHAEATSHTESQLDQNVTNREKFDAALFCAYHTNGTHVAYANAAVYRYRLPDGNLPLLTSLSAYVSSDPYNTLGARIVIMTNETGEIPTDCATCRGDVTGGIKAAGVSPRITRTVGDKNYWYPASSNVVFNASNGLSTGLQLQKYLFVFVLMENYATSRGNWIEGCSYLSNGIRITTSSEVPGWTDGSTVDLSNFSEEDDEIDVTEAKNIPWYGKMAAYDRKMTVVKLLDANGNACYFGAPENAFRLLHRNDTNLTALTHVVFRYGSSWGLGPKTNLTQASFAPSARPVKVRSVYADKSVTVMHGAVRMERGYEVNPPTRDMTDTDRGLVASYASAFGVSANSLESLAASTSIPVGWILYCGATSSADQDGDGLDIVHEWNNGNAPTDPFNPDTDGDTIVDGYALLYHLNGGDAPKDFDGDGLSNYAEYLVSNVFAFAATDPDRYSTGTVVCDYFKKVGDLYLGEIFTDHDRVDDNWERNFPSAANPYVYDSFRDEDGDGWSNFAEFMANTDPTRVTKDDGSPEFPVPTVRMRVVMRSKRRMSSIKVAAWNDDKNGDMTGIPDAKWTATNTDGTLSFELMESEPKSEQCLGRLREGKCSFICYCDDDGSGTYTVGEPFGVARGVDVGWKGASFAVELTETSAISPRINLWESANDRDTEISNLVQKTFATKDRVNVSIIRCGIDNMFAYMSGVRQRGFGNNYSDRVVMTRDFYKSGRPYVCEADFLGDGNLDIDWGTFHKGIVDANGNNVSGFDMTDRRVTNMTYLVVLDDGSNGFYGYDDTNTTVYVAGAFSRRFESNKSIPVCADSGRICYSARPTFRWSLPNEEAFACRFGTSYTAFKLQVWDETGSNKIYDSGVRRLPVQNEDGSFSWTADLSAGDLTSIGKSFGKIGNFIWRVAMYNAKFQPIASDFSIDNAFSGFGYFSVAVNAQQEMNDYGYSSIDVAVKYAGPALVLIDYDNINVATNKVHVQAFATADFTGEPLSETVVTAGVTNFTSSTANARLVGLPATGTYYIRAYIDSNGNHLLDEFESFGAAKESVTLTKESVVAPVVGVWIEDCDVDQDLLPDAWEYVKFGSISRRIADVKSSGRTIFTTEVKNAATMRMASFSTGLEDASMTIFENGAWARTLLGWGDARSTVTFDEIRNSVISNMTERIGQ